MPASLPQPGAGIEEEEARLHGVGGPVRRHEGQALHAELGTPLDIAARRLLAWLAGDGEGHGLVGHRMVLGDPPLQVGGRSVRGPAFSRGRLLAGRGQVPLVQDYADDYDRLGVLQLRDGPAHLRGGEICVAWV